MGPTSKPIYHLSLDVPAHAIAAFELALEPLVQSLLYSVDDEREIQTLEGFVETKPDPEKIKAAIAGAAALSAIKPPQVSLNLEIPRDWVAENLEIFAPLNIGRFYIHGSHTQARPPYGSIGLQVNSSVAFGTGQHASTAGCMAAIEHLAKRRRFENVLDMGTGSGILAMAAAALMHSKVMACDIDPKAVAVARANAKINRLSALVETRTGRGFGALHDHRYGPDAKTFDLIIANILARPLADMAPQLARHLLPGGYVVLSGLVVRDERRVLSRYLDVGIYLEARYVLNRWLTLVLRKPAQRPPENQQDGE